MSCRKGHTNNPAGINGGGFALPARKGDIWMDGRPWLPPTIRQMTREEAAYIGGLFDGDGSLWVRRKSWAVSFNNNDPELISAYLRLTQIGHVSGSIKRDKLHMGWRVERQADVLEFLLQIQPFSVKASEALS